MSSNTKQIDLSIVIPALNEEKRIGKTLEELAKFLKTNKTMRTIECEVLVVSANGTDNTHSVVRKHARRFKNFSLLLPGERLGKGRDVRFGMQKARGSVAVYMDADLATPLKHLPIFYKKITNTDAELVVATRNLMKHHSHLPRRLLSNAGNLLFRILGGVSVEDSQCGFKMFTKKAAAICFGRQTILKWGFDMELLTIAKTNNLKTEFVRINDWKNVPGGTFKASQIIQNSISSLQELLQIAKNRVAGKYKA